MNIFFVISLFILLAIPRSGFCDHVNIVSDSVPSIISNHLDNGFQYTVLYNDKPQREISLQLVLQAGRKHEPNGKTGLAHLVTHLQFSSLPESMVRKMQMSSTNFWSDEYAKVNQEETVFTFVLKQADQGSLAEYFQMLSQLVGNFKVGSEKFNTNKVLFQNELPRLMKDIMIADFFESLQNISDHDMASDYKSYINEVESLQLKDARAYFEEYYKPDRMTLIITGDLSGIDDIETIIADHFGFLKPISSSIRTNGITPIWDYNNDSVHINRMSGEHVFLSGFDLIFKQPAGQQSNQLSYQDFLVQQIVLRCVKGRLKPLNLNKSNQILHTSILLEHIVGRQPFLTLSTITRDNRIAFANVVQILHDLLEVGIDKEELNVILEEMESDIHKMTTDRLRPSSEQLSRNFLLSLTSPVPFRLPSQALAEFKDLRPAIDKSFMDQVLRHSLNLDSVKIFVYEEIPNSNDQISDEEILKYLHFK